MPRLEFLVPTGPCTPRTLRCEHAREYQYEMAPCCKAHLVGMMEKVCPLMTERGIRWFADYGTLLGAVANPYTTWADYPWLPQEGRTTAGPRAGIIPHDKDCDLGVLWEDWVLFRGLKPTLEKFGYSVRLVWSRGMAKIFLSRSNHTNIDIFFWLTRKNGTMYRKSYAEVDTCKGREFHRDMLFPLSTVPWEDMILPAPRDPEAFVAMRYPGDWKKPVMANHKGVRT